jgi:DNA-binding PadR family transcriptional regulator
MVYLIHRLTIYWGLIYLGNNLPLTEALFYILLAVRTPNHGYGIIQDVSEMTGGRVILGPGTLYGAINSMLSKGWISLYSEDKESRKKKEYLLTSMGKEVFKNEVKRLNELVKNAQKMDEEKGAKGC